MNINQLRYFQSIIKTGSFSETSKLLNVSEPTISNAIKRLENELNVQLFSRVGRRVVPTDAAMTYYYYISKSLKALDNGNDKLSHLNNIVSKIKVGFVYSLGPTFIPKLIKNYWQKYPNNDLSFIQKNSIELNSDLKKELCDVVICSFPDKKSPQMTYIPILEQDMVAVVSSKSKLAHKKTISVTEFGEKPLITFLGGSDVRNYIDNILLQNRVSPKKTIEFEEDRTIIGFVAQDMGYAILPKTEVINFEGVTSIPLSESLPPQYIYLGYEASKANLKGIYSFIEFVKEYCKINYEDVHRKI